jgi:glutathione synthase/RimK-type ligase-like ATP-grasp enzyme
MRIAIAKTSFDKELNSWINYCNENNIEYKLVNPYDSNIVEKVSDCDIFMWHHSQTKYKDLLFAKQLLFSLEQAGKRVYPNFHSNWHFDDKLGQKYLLEAAGAPLVKSYAFYDKKEALEWAKRTEYPKVFKLRCGAAAVNVKLIHSYKECKKYINKAFNKGFDSYSHNIIDFIKRVILYVLKNIKFKREKFDKEHGYVYFQDFMPNNEYDTRVVVIGGKYACAERRINRKNDFRASGSGSFSFDNIDINIVRIAFETAKKLKLQSVAYDFVYDENKTPRIVEICFGFGVKGISKSPGYYTDDLEWHKCDNVPIYQWIIEELVKTKNNDE